MSDPATRAEAARRKILASGDRELINRLHLLEATTPPPAAQRGPGLLGMGAAVAGGAWLGTVLAGMTLSGEMQDAFAAVAEDLGIDLGGLDTGAVDGVDASGEGDLFDGLGDFFDL